MKGQQSFNSFWIASTTAVLVTQPAWADTVQLTTVRLNPTRSGIEVFLETPKSESLAVFTSSYGRTFSADIINNTQLRLPKGNTFLASNPTDGITAVTVMPVDAKSIRVTVTGKAGLPIGKVVQSNQGLVLSFRTTDTSLVQAKSRPPKSHPMPTTSTRHQQLPQHKVSSAGRSKQALNKRNSQVAQAVPTPTLSPSPATDIPTQPTPAPSYLNPSPNPLQFPTRPEEVRIQGTQPITLQQAFDLARRNNRTLQVAELTLERSRAALRQAQAALLPTLNATAQFANSGQAFINGFSSSSGNFSSGTGNNLSGTANNSGSNATGVGGAVGTVGGSNTTGGGITTGGGSAGNLTVGNTTGTNVGTTTTTGTTTSGSTTTAGVINNTVSPSTSTSVGTTAAAATSVGRTAQAATTTGGTTTGGTTTGGTTTGGTTTGGTNTGSTTTGVTNVGGTTTGASSTQIGRFSSTALTGTLALGYNLYTSGGRSASIRAAEEQVRFDQLGVEIAAQQLRLDVSNDYYNLQGADQQVLIYQAAVRNAQASLRDTQAQERAGVGTRFDVLRSQVQLANQIQNLTSSLAQQQTYRRQLAQRLSIAQSVDVSAADPVQLAGLWNFSLEDSIVLAFKNRAELEQYLTTRNIAEQNRRLALSTLGPQVSLSAQYVLNDVLFGLSTTPDIPYVGGASDQYTVGVVARLVLFDGGAARASAAQQEVNKAIAETNFANERNLVRFNVEQYYSSLQSNLSNIQTATLAVAQATEALRLARLRFQAGVGTQTDVISSENDLTNAEGTRVNAILNYNRSLANLQREVSSGEIR